MSSQRVQVRRRPSLAAYAVLVAWVIALGPRLAYGQAATAQPHAGSAPTPLPAAEAPVDVLTANVVRSNFELSYLAYPIGLSGLDSLLFESSIVPQFFVSQPSWPVAFVLTPKIVVRMFNERSVPIKTPSYMPRVSFFAWFTHALSPGEYTTYASITLSHHSNGQSGAFFRDDGSINHETGDFSTNYLEFAAYGTRLQQTFFGWNELAFIWHLNFNQNSELRDRYGLLRLYYSSTLVELEQPVAGKITLQVGAILDDFLHTASSSLGRALERFPIGLQYTVTVPGFDLGFYAGYYYGHDYYNIWFDRVVHAFQLGISGSVGPVLFQDE